MTEQSKLCARAAVSLAICSIVNAEPPTTNPAGTLAANDLIKVSVTDLMQPGAVTPASVHLDEKGRATLPMLKDIDLHGLTTDVAAERISKAYNKAQILRKAVVTVTIIEPAAQSTIAPGPLRAGDKVDVTVFDLTGPGTSQTVSVIISKEGTIELPLVKPVAIVGQSEGEATRTIAKAYKNEQVITSAVIIVCRTG